MQKKKKKHFNPVSIIFPELMGKILPDLLEMYHWDSSNGLQGFGMFSIFQGLHGNLISKFIYFPEQFIFAIFAKLNGLINRITIYKAFLFITDLLKTVRFVTFYYSCLLCRMIYCI